MRRRSFVLSASTALAIAYPATVQAQADRPLRIFVGFPPGASTDTVARLLADKIKDELKRPVWVESKVGAGGRVAAELLKNAPADGTVVLLTPVVVPVLAPLVFSKLNYNPSTDLSPVGHVCNFNFALAVKADFPARNLNEFITWIKANPQKANYGTSGAGSLPHFFGILLGREAKVDLLHIPYNGGAPLQTAILGDQVSAGIDVVLESLQQHKSGKLRVLATSGRIRSKVLPDVPTFAEQGFPNIVGAGWFAMYAPAGMSKNDVNTINHALNKALALPDIAEKFLNLGLEVGGGSPADLTRLMVADTERWAPIVKYSGFKAD